MYQAAIETRRKTARIVSPEYWRRREIEGLRLQEGIGGPIRGVVLHCL